MSLTHDPHSLRQLIDQVGADRIVIGTDNPFDMGYADLLAELEQVPNLSPYEREQIRTGTAKALLDEG